MRHGFVKVAAATPDIRVADVEFNKENICRGIEEAEKANAKILVFPELCDYFRKSQETEGSGK